MLSNIRHSNFLAFKNRLTSFLTKQSFSGQSISVGNLGLVSMRAGDISTAKACMEQHLSLVQSLKDLAAETNAWMQVEMLLESFALVHYELSFSFLLLFLFFSFCEAIS